MDSTSVNRESVSEEPEVGIFWIYEDELFHPYTISVSKASEYAGFKTLEEGHYKIWDVYFKRGILDRLPPCYHEDYALIPRGRVVYNIESSRYIVYHGDIFTEKNLKDVVKRFKLPQGGYKTEIDEHYIMADILDDLEYLCP